MKWVLVYTWYLLEYQTPADHRAGSNCALWTVLGNKMLLFLDCSWTFDLKLVFQRCIMLPEGMECDCNYWIKSSKTRLCKYLKSLSWKTECNSWLSLCVLFHSSRFYFVRSYSITVHAQAIDASNTIWILKYFRIFCWLVEDLELDSDLFFCSWVWI